MAELPRLLLCTFDVVPAPSGMSRRLTEYLAAMEEHFSVSVLSVKTPDHSHIEKYRGARLMRVPVGEKDLASRIQAFDRAVRRQLESEEYAVVHFTDPFGGYALCETRGEYSHKLVYEAQAFPSQEVKHTLPQASTDRRFQNRIRRQELFCLMNADAIVTGSNLTRDFIHSLGVPEESVRVLRQPVDLSLYKIDALGTPDGTPMRALYLGTAWPWQGLLTLIDAARFAVDEAELTVSIVGAFSPEITAELQERISDLQLKDVVQLQPAVPHDDLFKIVAACDVGIAPLEAVDRNLQQGGALAKVGEYFAGGRAVIASDVPLAREVVSDEAGIFFEPGNPRALADELVKLANDKETRKRLGKRARVHAEQRHDSKRIQRQLLDLYKALLGGSVSAELTAKRSGGGKAEVGTSPGTPTKKAEGGRRRKTEKTDPAIRMPKRAEEPTTDPEKQNASERPVLMGVPVNATPPPVEQEHRTDRAAPVLGRPPRSLLPESFVGVSPAGPLLTGSGKHPPAELAVPSAPTLPDAPPPLRDPPDHLAVRPSTEPQKAAAPMSTSAAPLAPQRLPAPAPAAGPVDEPDEISADEVMDADAEALDAGSPDDEPEDASHLAVSTDEHPAGESDEPEHVSQEEIAEVEENLAPTAEVVQQAGAFEDANALTSLNPWYAQLVHGHCPPDGSAFVRPTPPTNFPGREAAAPKSAAPAQTLRPKAEK